jgi:hypothetical protein
MPVLETSNIYYANYPETLTVSIPAEEVELPYTADAFTIPADTSHIVHLLYLGKKDTFDESTPFWEQKRASAEPEGEVVSNDQYTDFLENRFVASAPENVLWQPAKTLWVRRFGMSAVVEDSPDNDQCRVTMVARNKATNKSKYEHARTGNDFSNTLTEHGFPQEAFDYLREDEQVFANRTDKLGNMLIHPVVRPLTTAIQRTAVTPLLALSMRRIPDDQLISVVRTNKKS